MMFPSGMERHKSVEGAFVGEAVRPLDLLLAQHLAGGREPPFPLAWVASVKAGVRERHPRLRDYGSTPVPGHLALPAGDTAYSPDLHGGNT